MSCMSLAAPVFCMSSFVRVFTHACAWGVVSLEASKRTCIFSVCRDEVHPLRIKGDHAKAYSLLMFMLRVRKDHMFEGYPQLTSSLHLLFPSSLAPLPSCYDALVFFFFSGGGGHWSRNSPCGPLAPKKKYSLFFVPW